MSARAETAGARGYFARTRAAWPAYLLVLPLLALYHAAAFLANLGERRAVINGADALVQRLVGALGAAGWLGSWIVLAVVGGLVVFRTTPPAERKRPPARDWAGVLLESTLYALLLGTVAAQLTAALLPGVGALRIGPQLSPGQMLAAGLGAGLYEELVFRAGLLGGGLWALKRAGLRPVAAASLALLGSSLVFSAFHYVGPLGEPFQAVSFTYRAVAGAVLGGLFLARGFAVAAWTHALYDVFLLATGAA